MSFDSKKVLVINLSRKEFEVKSFTDLNKYIGGVGTGVKLFQIYKEYDPIIFSIGPLSGLFPFASKTNVIVDNGGVIEDIYLGGSLSNRMKFAGLDSIVLLGKSKEACILDILNSNVEFNQGDSDIHLLGLPGKRSASELDKNKIVVDGYFISPESFLDEKLSSKQISGFCVTGTEKIELNNFEKYDETYYKVLNQSFRSQVSPGLYPSCTGCPMGCIKSKVGEIGGNVLLHSLVVCQYAEPIYSDIGVVFSCLNCLGYDYTHEDIENLPKLIEAVLKDLS